MLPEKPNGILHAVRVCTELIRVVSASTDLKDVYLGFICASKYEENLDCFFKDFKQCSAKDSDNWFIPWTNNIALNWDNWFIPWTNNIALKIGITGLCLGQTI